MTNNKKIALVLGGGGARGISHIGIIKALNKAEIKPDLIVGCSAGALIGAGMAAGKTGQEMEDFLNSLTKKQVASLLSMTPPIKSLIRGDKGFSYLGKKMYDNKNIEDLDIPMKIVATHLGSGAETVFEKGSLIQAVQASCTVPGILPPIKIGDKHYIDGGVVNPTPIDIAFKAGFEIVIGVDLIMKKDMNLEKPNIITTLLQAYEIIRTEGTKHKIASTPGNPIMIEPEARGTIESFKFNKMSEFIESGEKAAEKTIPEIKKRINS